MLKFFYIKELKKESIMLKKILISLMLISSLSHSETMVSENSNLKLKLEIFELKEQINQLNQIIERLQISQQKSFTEEQKRMNAIQTLKSDLRQGRRKHTFNNLLLSNG